MYRLVDLPFSTAGAALVFGYLQNRLQRSDYVALRTVRGDGNSADLLQLVPDGVEPGRTDATFTPTLLTVPAAHEPITVRFDAPGVLRIDAGSDLSLQAGLPVAWCYDSVVAISETEAQLIRHSAATTLTVEAVRGRLTVESTWDGVRNPTTRVRIPAGSIVTITEREDDGSPEAADPPGWAAWLDSIPSVPSRWDAARELAGYVMWSALVAPRGHYTRPSMLMSKNWMMNVWSWDHCFNALGLPGLPGLAWDQYRTVFDHQSPSGALPDSIGIGRRSYSYVKPPIHGWALDRLAEQGTIGAPQLAEAYDGLARWTLWWLTQRVLPGRRLPHYYHGNDSGWDNSTAFIDGGPLETPDLAAFLVLQCRTLARIAADRGDDEARAGWTHRADDLLEALIDELWTGDRFVARDPRTGAEAASDSLLLMMPLVLGEQLPRAVFDALADRLEGAGFVTAHGLATEPPSSPHYRDDGYWRGPIWAPTTCLLIDGLRRGGREGLARELATRFCDMVAAAGMAENFDALSGAGLRDRAYTWTAGVFLYLASWLEGVDSAARG